MDGTLLVTAGDQIHPLNKKVFKNWQQAGKKIVLATGRLDLAILPFIHELEINMPVISCNGGLVRDFKTGAILYKSDIEVDKVARILEKLAEFNADYHVYTTERILGPSITGKIAFFTGQNRTLPENEQVPITITQTPLNELRENEYLLKILVVENNGEKREKIRTALASLDMSVLSSGANLIDIMNKGIDKAHGLRFLAEQGYLDLKTTISFGDNENDIAMLELTEIGVAMKNSIPLTLEKADKVADSNDNGGVGAFIQANLEEGT
ncbi:HAD family hydrolase [Listeria sp. PSOL-1]|uniref:HAD family hydrolase n=1 Tax=Listeria sp. PSOL-1 TaxID=1844999 RepID=UPI0013D85F1E|nr:HAD family hydrolase [Listeria sp. PSOL-1]